MLIFLSPEYSSIWQVHFESEDFDQANIPQTMKVVYVDTISPGQAQTRLLKASLDMSLPLRQWIIASANGS